MSSLSNVVFNESEGKRKGRIVRACVRRVCEETHLQGGLFCWCRDSVACTLSGVNLRDWVAESHVSR
jgi:hypothetical protein